MGDAAERLAVLIEAEREALLSGDLDRITALMPEKAALSDALRDTPDIAADLVPLRAAIQRNHDLFDRALAGLRAVAARLAVLQDVRTGLRTYDRSGQERRIAGIPAKKLERRA